MLLRLRTAEGARPLQAWPLLGPLGTPDWHLRAWDSAQGPRARARRGGRDVAMDGAALISEAGGGSEEGTALCMVAPCPCPRP